MRKNITSITCTLLCLLLNTSMMFTENAAAADDKSNSRFTPSVSIGYAFGSDTDANFTSITGAGLGGVTKSTLNIPAFSGTYLAAELPFLITDRFKLTLAGSWAFQGDNQDLQQYYNINVASRKWDIDSRNWYTLDLLLSYAFVKNMDFVKDVSAVIGFRYDYSKIGLNNPFDVHSILNASTNTLDFEMTTYAPLIGITSTFKGFKSGILGGDIKLGFICAPYAWSDISYRETFGSGTTSISFNGDGKRSWFYSISGEMALISGKIGSGKDASLALFGQFTEFYSDDTVTGIIAGGFAGAPVNFKAETHTNVGVIGLKGYIAF